MRNTEPLSRRGARPGTPRNSTVTATMVTKPNSRKLSLTRWAIQHPNARRNLAQVALRKDPKDKKPPVGKAELKRRVRMVVQTKKAKYTCRRMLRSLVKTAQIVIKKKGAASGL